jgi:alpha-tubulin suppressor-like RCC1 family protein
MSLLSMAREMPLCMCYGWGVTMSMLSTAREMPLCTCIGWGTFEGFSNDEEVELVDRKKASELAAPRLLELSSRVMFVKVACGHRHVLLLTKYGEVYSFGNGSAGRLGHGDDNSIIEIPKKIEALEGGGVEMIACGRDHSIVATKNGLSFGFGWGERGRIGLGDVGAITTPRMIIVDGSSLEVDGHAGAVSSTVIIRGIAAGREHSLLLDQEGRVYAMGSGECGQLGLFDTASGIDLCCLYPQRIVHGLEAHVVQIAAGEMHSAALDSLGVLYTWGYDSCALGRKCQGGKIASSDYPGPVGGLPVDGIEQVSCSGMITVAKTTNGRAFLWGDLSTDTDMSNISSVISTPEELKMGFGVKSLSSEEGIRVKYVAAGPRFVMAIGCDERLYHIDENGCRRVSLPSSPGSNDSTDGASLKTISCGTYAWLALQYTDEFIWQTHFGDIQRECCFDRPVRSVDAREEAIYKVNMFGADTMFCHHLNESGLHCVLNGIHSDKARKCKGVMFVHTGRNGKSLVCHKARAENAGHSRCTTHTCPFMNETDACPYMDLEVYLKLSSMERT